MRLKAQSWKQLVYYGEVVGFLLAWIVGIEVLTRNDTRQPRLAGVDGFATVSEAGRPDAAGSSNELE